MMTAFICVCVFVCGGGGMLAEGPASRSSLLHWESTISSILAHGNLLSSQHTLLYMLLSLASSILSSYFQLQQEHLFWLSWQQNYVWSVQSCCNGLDLMDSLTFSELLHTFPKHFPGFSKMNGIPVPQREKWNRSATFPFLRTKDLYFVAL